MPPVPHEAGPALAAELPEVDDQGRDVRITVLSRAGCHLCRRALAVIDDVCRDTGVGYHEVDIDIRSPALRADLVARYGDWLPVVFVDGRAHDYWTVEPDRLRQRLVRG